MSPAETCPFCRIARREAPARIVHEDPLCVAFEDLRPQAPVHVLVIPRKHVETTNDLLPEDEPLVGHLVAVATAIARERGVAESGYRTVLNCNRAAGQAVWHLHLHLLAGRSFGWPPG
ncbi:MAG: histidine triad nucleotide-binding protein [Acidobacteria bacterium]|nr:histidine triad nucleotide-binding protein [Acidobacteriota bacterium]